MLHHGNVMYVKKAFKGTDCARFVSFQKWKVWVKPLIVQSGLYAPSSNSERKEILLITTQLKGNIFQVLQQQDGCLSTG